MIHDIFYLILMKDQSSFNNFSKQCQIKKYFKIPNLFSQIIIWPSYYIKTLHKILTHFKRYFFYNISQIKKKSHYIFLSLYTYKKQMKIDQLPKILFLHEQSQQMQDRRIRSKVDYDTTADPPRKVVKKKINNTIQITQKLKDNNQINCLHYSNKLGLLVTFLEEEVLFTDLHKLETYFTTPQTAAKSLKEISGYIKFSGKGYMSLCQTKILLVDSQKFIYFDLIDMVGTSAGKNEHGLRHITIINDKSFVGWNFQQKSYLYTIETGQIPSGKPFQNISCCTSVNLINKNLFICQKFKDGQDQSTHIMIYSQNGQTLLNELDLSKYQNNDNYLFNYTLLLSVFEIRRQKQGEYSDNDVYGLVLGYYDDYEEEPDRRYLNFLKGNVVKKDNDDIQIRGFELFQSPNQDRSFYYDQNQNKIPFQVQVLNNHDMKVIMIQKLQVVYVVDSTLPFNQLNIYSMNPVQQIKLEGGKFFNGICLMKNMLLKQRVPPVQDSNETCNMICRDFNGQFLSLYFPAKETELTVPFPATLLVLGNNKIERRYAVSTNQQVEQYQVDNIKEGISKIKNSKYIESISNHVKVDAHKKYEIQQKSTKKNQPQAISKYRIQKQSIQQKQTKQESTNRGGFSLFSQPPKPASTSIFDKKLFQNVPTKQEVQKPVQNNSVFGNNNTSSSGQATKGPSLSIFDKKQQPKQGNQSKPNSLFGNNNQGTSLFGSGNTSALGGLFGNKSNNQAPKQSKQFKPNALFGQMIANPNQQKKPFQNLLGSNVITPGSNILSSKQTPGGPAVTNNLLNKDDKNKVQPPAKQETKRQDKKQSFLFGGLTGMPSGSNATTGESLFGLNKTEVKKQQSKQKQVNKQKTELKQGKQPNKQSSTTFSNFLNKNNTQSDLFKNIQNSAKQPKTNDAVKKEQKIQGAQSMFGEKAIFTNPTDYSSGDKADKISKTKTAEVPASKVSQKSQKVQEIQKKSVPKASQPVKKEQTQFSLSKLSVVQQQATQLSNQQKLKQLASILGFPNVQSLSQPLKMLTNQQIDALIPSLKSISKAQPKIQSSPQLSPQQKARKKLLKQQYLTPLIQTFDSIKKYITNAKQQNTFSSMSIFSLKNCKVLLKQPQQKKIKQNKLNSLNPLLSVVRNYTKRMQFLQGQYKHIDFKLLQNYDTNNRDNKTSQHLRKQQFLEKQIQECQRKCSTILYYQDTVKPQKQNQDMMRKLFTGGKNKNDKIQNSQERLQYFQYKMVNLLKQKSSKTTLLTMQIQKQLQQIDELFELDDNQQGSRSKIMKKSSSKLSNNLLGSSMISNASSLSKKKKGLFTFNLQNNTSSSSDESDRQVLLPNVLPFKSLYEPENQRKHILIKFTQRPIDVKEELKRITPLVMLQEDYQEPQLKYAQAQTRNVSQLFKGGIGGSLNNMQSSSMRKSVNFKEKIPIKKEDNEKQILTKVKQVDHSEIDASQDKERQRHRLRSFRDSSDEDQGRSDEGSLEDVDAPQIMDRNISFAPQKIKNLNDNKMPELGKNGLNMKQTLQIDVAEKGKQVEKKQKSAAGLFDNKSGGALSFGGSGKAGLFDGNNKLGNKQVEKQTKPQQKKSKQGTKQTSKASLFGDLSSGAGTLLGIKKQQVNIKPKTQEKPTPKQGTKKQPQPPKSLFGANNTTSLFSSNNTGSLFGAKDQKKEEKKQKQSAVPTGLFGDNKTLLNNIIKPIQQKQSQPQAKKGAFSVFTSKKTSQQPSTSLFGDKSIQQKPSLFNKAKQLQKQIQKKQKQCENLKDKSKPALEPQNKKDDLKEQLANQINKIGNLTTEIKENIADNKSKVNSVFGSNNVAPQSVADTGLFGNQQKTQMFGQANTVTHQVPKFGAQNKFMAQQTNQANQQGGNKVFNPNAGSFGDGFSQPSAGGLKSFSSFAPQTGGNSLFGGNQGQQNVQTNQTNPFGNNPNTNTTTFGPNTQVAGQSTSLFGQSSAVFGQNQNSMFNQNQNAGSLFGGFQQQPNNPSMNTGGGFLSSFNPTANQQQAPLNNQSAMFKPRK